MRGSSLAAALAVVALTSCNYDGRYGEHPTMVEVAVGVHHPKAFGGEPHREVVSVPYGASVWDATVRALPGLDGPGGVCATGHTGWFEGMERLRDNEAGKRNGWSLAVNGTPVRHAPTALPVRHGDVVVWRYDGP